METAASAARADGRSGASANARFATTAALVSPCCISVSLREKPDASSQSVVALRA